MFETMQGRQAGLVGERMLIIRGVGPVAEEARGAVIAIGNFDGVHKGHKALIGQVRDIAAQLEKPSGVLAFEPHPRTFFAPQAPHFRLTSLEEKLRLLELQGLDLAVVVPFNAELAGLSADAFIAQVLVDQLGVSHVAVGDDFHFGKKRLGTASTLEAAGGSYGFGVTILDKKGEGGAAFSSSRVRKALAAGDVGQAAHVLGHWWRIAGKVTHGAKLGTELGFPTANIELPAGTELGPGIYAVHVHVAGTDYKGAAYYGRRPSVDNGAPRLEVFIFDFSGDLYESEIAVSFVARIRDDKRFESFDDLKAQIAKDCAAAREILTSPQH